MSVMTAELTRTFRSMASPIELRVVEPNASAPEALDRAVDRIEAVAQHLTRFDEASALCRMNQHPDAWHVVPRELADAVDEAYRAHLVTGGRFDPRVLDALVAWGYDATFSTVLAAQDAADPTATAWVDVDSALPARPVPDELWLPEVLHAEADTLVRPGAALDLGGIGKGLAVRWAATELLEAGVAALVNAGGDGWLGGAGPSGAGWMIGVEDPYGDLQTDQPAGEDPVLVLRLSDCAVATSSIRRRRWRANGTPVHHLVDPSSGLPGGEGMAQVTVVHNDPAWAEIWSKTLFLAGTAHIAERAEDADLAVAWVGEDGAIGVSAAMARHVEWAAR